MNNFFKKLILFDIDGTLLASGRGAIASLKQAINQHVGKIPEIGYSDTAGKTDRLIMRDLLRQLSIPEEQIPEKVDAILSTYLEILPALYNADHDARLFPNALDFVTNLSQRKDCVLGLITGNVEKGARIKLQPFDLNKYFSFGAFGSDAMFRSYLPSIAVYRASKLYNKEFVGEDIIIIGDTADDVTCGKSLGVRAIAVVRREENRQSIEAQNPYYVCTGFEEYEKIIEKIFE